MRNWKGLPILLCSLLLAIIFPIKAFATQTPELIVESSGGCRGGTVQVAVTLSAVGGIAGGSFQIEYDPAQLTLLAADPGEAMPSGMAGINKNYKENAAKVSFASVSPLTTPGNLCILTFQIHKDAVLGPSAVTVRDAVFYGVNQERIVVGSVPGTVTAQSVDLTLSTTECLPGQEAAVSAALSGGLTPAGGEFEIHYNARMMAASAAKAEQSMGGTAINVSVNLNYAPGVVKVSWAASEEVAALGRICSVIFLVSGSAQGEAPVTLENVRFYDESGTRLDYTATSGAVTATPDYNANPSLYVVGGLRQTDGTATVQVALDGAGIVCGGSFSVRYDPTLCTLKKIVNLAGTVAINPEVIQDVQGSLTVTWADASPALDQRGIVELVFDMRSNEAADLNLEMTSIRDSNGGILDISAVAISGGKVGIADSLQMPVTEVVDKNKSIEISTTLYDAAFCTGERTLNAQIVAAAYVDGKMQFASVPASAVQFDQNGIASAQIELAAGTHVVDQVQLFVLSGEGSLTPLCPQVDVEK